MPPDAAPKARPRSLWSYIFGGAALFVFIQTFPVYSPILLAFVLTILISLAANPLVMRLWRVTGSRKLAAAMLMMGGMLIVGCTGWILFGPLKDSSAQIVDKIPEYWERIQKPLIKIETQAGLSEERLQQEVTTEVAHEKSADGERRETQRAHAAGPGQQQQAGGLRTGLAHILQGLAESLKAIAANAAQMVIVFITVFFAAVMTMMNPVPVFRAIFACVPERHHGKALTIIKRIAEFVPAWAFATALSMLTVGVLVFLLMWPIFDFTDALVLGLIAGIFEVVPYLGPFLSFIPALLFALGDGGLAPLWVTLAFIAVHELESNVIAPLIVARRMQLHPVAVIFSMLICVESFGVLGLLIATPIVAIVDILHDEIYVKHFLPNVTERDLEALARDALDEPNPRAKQLRHAAHERIKQT